METIFKALNDPARRALLDSLRTTDGQTLTELEEQLDMSRFGVMKHLKVLEDAHLVTTRKTGRFKHHYLNALPLQEVVDRWINPFLQPQAKALLALKSQLETSMSKPDFVMSTFIDCTHDALWDALTKGDLISHYHFACKTVEGDYGKSGDEVSYLFPDGRKMLSNRVISINPKTRIEMSFHPNWDEDDSVSRCVYIVEPQKTAMKLTVEHFDLVASQSGISEGWARFLSGLKTYLEKGSTPRFSEELAS